QLTWTADLVIWIGQHFVPLSNPAHGTSQGEDSGEQGGWDTNSALNDTRVEVYVGVQLAFDEVWIFQSNALQFHGQLEQRIVLQAQGFQNFLASLLHQLGAWVVVLVDTVTKAHQAHARVLVLDLLHKLANLVDAAVGLQLFEHVQARFVCTTVGRTPQASNTRSNSSERIGAGRTAQTHGGSRGVLFVICMQDEDTVQSALNHFVDLVVFARGSEHHAQEVAGVGQIILGIDEGLSQRILVRHRNQSRQLGDQADSRHMTVMRIRDVRGVMVERRQSTDQASQYCHGVGVRTEAAQEVLHLFLNHGVVRDQGVKFLLLICVGQLAVQDQVAHIHEIALLCQLVDRVTTVHQLSLVAVNVGDTG